MIRPPPGGHDYLGAGERADLSTLPRGDGTDAGPDADPDAGPDADPDAGPDAGRDAGRDAGPDAGPVAGRDAGPDVGPYAGPDVGPDAGTATGPDVGRDAGPDAGTGSGRPRADHSTEATHTSVGEAGEADEAGESGEVDEVGVPTVGRRRSSSPTSLIGARDLATRAHQPGSAWSARTPLIVSAIVCRTCSPSRPNTATVRHSDGSSRSASSRQMTYTPTCGPSPSSWPTPGSDRSRREPSSTTTIPGPHQTPW